MNKELKNDIKILKNSFSKYQKIRKVIEKSGTLITSLSKYYNYILSDEECNEEYYRDDYDNIFDVDIFESNVRERTAELLIVLHALMLDMDSKERVRNAMKRIAREQVKAIQLEKDRIRGR